MLIMFRPFHCPIYSTRFRTRMCHTIFEENTFPTKRKIRCVDMLRNNCFDVSWHLDSNKSLSTKEQMLCFIDMVRVKIWNVWTHCLFNCCRSLNYQCSHHIYQIIQDNLGRAKSKNCSISYGVLPRHWCRIIGKSL